jgi:hypothetical protein
MRLQRFIGAALLALALGATPLSAFATQIFLTSGTSWTVPSDWNNASNTVEAIGAGGSGDIVDDAGGGGGEYRAITNFSATAGSNIPIVIGTGNANGNDGGATKFNTTSLIANGGKAGASGTGGAGGSGGTGTIGNNGGTGANGVSQAGGGGGAGGPNGVGGAGGLGLSGNGGGGGGGGGGTAGGNATASVGGTGGNNHSGTGGGAGGTGSGTGNGGNGTNGGGGGGGNGVGSSSAGGTGGAGTDWDASHGSGGGGGGAGTGGAPGNGGLYGGGGGGANVGAGSGAQGIIVITYTPSGPPSSSPHQLPTLGVGQNQRRPPRATVFAAVIDRASGALRMVIVPSHDAELSDPAFRPPGTEQVILPLRRPIGLAEVAAIQHANDNGRPLAMAVGQ